MSIIGRKKNDREIKEIVKKSKFKIDFDHYNNLLIKIPATKRVKAFEHKPEDIPTFIIEYAVKIVKNKARVFPYECAISISSDFSKYRSDIVNNATNKAGFNRVELVKEQESAVAAYQGKEEYDDKKNFLVVDLEVQNLKFLLLIIKTTLTKFFPA